MLFASFFAIIAGFSMIGQWIASYKSGQIPELETEPIRIGFHIAAEIITASALIGGGAALLTRQAWGKDLFLIAMGMLFYTTIVSPGYFAQKGQWIWPVIFGVLILLGLVSVFLIV